MGPEAYMQDYYIHSRKIQRASRPLDHGRHSG